jgi:1-acyl-sn-glycerol-3-phosphate acyltransferase
MSKSVLGDDPFSSPEGGKSPDEAQRRTGSDEVPPSPSTGETPEDSPAAESATDEGVSKRGTAGEATTKKATTKKATTKKATTKKATTKKATTKKRRGETGDATRAAQAPDESQQHRGEDRGAERVQTDNKTPRSGGEPGPRPDLTDGATARRAARATASFQDIDVAAPSQPRSATLDDTGKAIPPQPSLSDELRRVEQHVTGRLRGAAELRFQRRSLLDRVGELLRLDTYRSVFSALMMRNRSDRVDDFGMDPVYAEKWRPLLQFLYESYWRVETSGMENIPDHGRALIVANHSGTLPYDGAMIMYAIRFNHPAHRDVRPMVEDFVFHFPYLGVALNRIGCVRACQENAERLLDTEQVIAVFPEGIKGIGKLYRDKYQLQRFGRGGFIKLALKKRAPIIPTAVIGAEEIYPMMAKVTWLAKYLGIPYIPVTPTFPWLGPAGALPVPSKWRIRFGEPLDLSSQYGPDAHQDRILVNRLAEQVRSRIQSMVDEQLTTRRSIIFG